MVQLGSNTPRNCVVAMLVPDISQMPIPPVDAFCQRRLAGAAKPFDVVIGWVVVPPVRAVRRTILDGRLVAPVAV